MLIFVRGALHILLYAYLFPFYYGPLAEPYVSFGFHYTCYLIAFQVTFSATGQIPYPST